MPPSDPHVAARGRGTRRGSPRVAPLCPPSPPVRQDGNHVIAHIIGEQTTVVRVGNRPTVELWVVSSGSRHRLQDLRLHGPSQALNTLSDTCTRIVLQWRAARPGWRLAGCPRCRGGRWRWDRPPRPALRRSGILRRRGRGPARGRRGPSW